MDTGYSNLRIKFSISMNFKLVLSILFQFFISDCNILWLYFYLDYKGIAPWLDLQQRSGGSAPFGSLGAKPQCNGVGQGAKPPDNFQDFMLILTRRASVIGIVTKSQTVIQGVKMTVKILAVSCSQTSKTPVAPAPCFAQLQVFIFFRERVRSPWLYHCWLRIDWNE